jgi:hypothetical protein
MINFILFKIKFKNIINYKTLLISIMPYKIHVETLTINKYKNLEDFHK